MRGRFGSPCTKAKEKGIEFMGHCFLRGHLLILKIPATEECASLRMLIKCFAGSGFKVYMAALLT